MTNPPSVSQDLTVKGESIERIYGSYKKKQYVVNRRYQRKLVWTLQEKQNFIDSIIKGYPVPIILLAESSGSQNCFEIIDGMQRLNAILGFIENEYSVNGNFFDLNTMADTKVLLDSNSLEQKEPIFSRDLCISVASYQIPLSIYEFSQNHEVDEVFRRINSGGKKLSRQELRIAGATGHFANAVRIIASSIRGDASEDKLLLQEMKKISITNRELSYGIVIDEVFWVKQGILSKDLVRESKDEEIIADLLAFMILDNKPSSRTEYLDDYFGFREREGDAAKQRFNEVEIKVQQISVEHLKPDFHRVLDQVKLILNRANCSFGELLFDEKSARAPRYFQVVFLALHQLLVKDNQEVNNEAKLVELLRNSGQDITIPEGGRWSAEKRSNAVNSMCGRLRPVFQPRQSYDPAQVRWITQLENLLNLPTEQPVLDVKQGFLRLDGNNSVDEASLVKVLETLVGIANIKRGIRGYIIIGVADCYSTAERVKNLFNIEYKSYGNFFITGLEHEAKALDKNPDQLFHWVKEKIVNSKISEPLKSYIASNIKFIRYYDKLIFVLESQAQVQPSHFDGQYFIRQGTDLHEVPSTEFGSFFANYSADS